MEPTVPEPMGLTALSRFCRFVKYALKSFLGMVGQRPQSVNWNGVSLASFSENAPLAIGLGSVVPACRSCRLPIRALDAVGLQGAEMLPDAGNSCPSLITSYNNERGRPQFTDAPDQLLLQGHPPQPERIRGKCCGASGQR